MAGKFRGEKQRLSHCKQQNVTQAPIITQAAALKLSYRVIVDTERYLGGDRWFSVCRKLANPWHFHFFSFSPPQP